MRPSHQNNHAVLETCYFLATKGKRFILNLYPNYVKEFKVDQMF